MFDMEYNQAVAKALQIHRVLRDMSYNELAEKSGVSIQTIYRIFGAKRDIKVDPLSKIAGALQVPVSRIMEDAEKIARESQ